jgi:hypothetical protein
MRRSRQADGLRNLDGRAKGLVDGVPRFQSWPRCGVDHDGATALSPRRSAEKAFA